VLRLIALAGFAAATLGSSIACAQNATFYTASYVEVGPVLAKVGATALLAYREAGRKDQGAVILDVFQRVEQPNQFVVLGAWADQKAFEGHTAGAASKKLSEKLATLLASPVDIRTHDGIAASPSRTGKDPIIVVTHVDVLPANKDTAANALEQLSDQSRKQSGNLRFDVWRQTGRPNHFTVIEAWANRGAFDLHQMQKDTREFRGKLAPMLGALYDERLYKPMP
jgi:quinol monooxygenase YgiN